jgi:hypothetical protein
MRGLAPHPDLKLRDNDDRTGPFSKTGIAECAIQARLNVWRRPIPGGVQDYESVRVAFSGLPQNCDTFPEQSRIPPGMDPYVYVKRRTPNPEGLRPAA